jgi:hypothetical protein
MAQGVITLAGTVKKLIDRSVVDEPQQAQIYLAGADHLYDELRVPNIHEWEVGTGIEVTIRPR